MIPPKKVTATVSTQAAPLARVQFAQLTKSTAGHRVLLYGPGGIGKTTLGVKAPGKVAFIDTEDSLPILKTQLDAQEIELPSVVPVTNFKDTISNLKLGGWEPFKTIVIEVTRMEEWCVAETLSTVPHEKGHKIAKIEDYGFGKGYQYVFDTFLTLLAQLDRHARAGRNVILIAHDCVNTVPNPEGDDWLRYEPRLQNPKTGKASIQLRVKEWADHVLFYGYDVAAAKDKKAKGSGTRTIYTAERPYCMAKSRTHDGTPIPVDPTVDVWSEIIK